MLGKFPKHEVPMGLDANAKLAGHSDGFRVGYVVPHSDMTAGDEERATFFLNFMAQKKNTWTAAAAPQEMHTRRLCFDMSDSRSKKWQSPGKPVHEHGPQRRTDMSKEEKKRTNKTHIMSVFVARV